MSSDSEIAFTSEQLNLIERSGSHYVEACPGAGKTQALAERFVRRPNNHPRKGVALLSFTNAAIDEARTRCAASPELLMAPNFAGTIDKFINRFIVAPVHTATSSAPSKFVDVWGQLPHTTVKCKHVDATARLEWFEFDANHSAKLTPKAAPIALRKKLTSLEEWKVARLEERATVIYKQMLARGYHDSSSARRAALVYLSDASRRAALTSLLSARFSEVIVDEAQDCSDEDVLILEWINEAGPELILVGDPDQSIFDFRGRSPNAGERLKTLVPVGSRLTGNFRSTPAICRLANSLRSTSTSVDEAVGKHKSSTQPVLLFRYSKPKQVTKMTAKVLAEHDFPLEQCVLLAHSSRQAASCAGGSIVDGMPNGRVARIAAAFDQLRSEASTPKQRRDALNDLSVCLHEGAHDAFKDLPRPEFLEAIGKTQREHDTLLLRLAFTVSVDRDQPPSVFKDLLGQGLVQHGVHWVRTGALPAPSAWPKRRNEKLAVVDHGSIHSYKGLQRDLVVVVIPESGERPDDQTGVGQWCSDAPGEPRRVLYVGATRAAQVLMLAVHDAVHDRVREKLVSDDVPFKTVE